MVDFTSRCTLEDVDYLYFSGYFEGFELSNDMYEHGLYNLVVGNGYLEAALMLMDFYPDWSKLTIFDSIWTAESTSQLWYISGILGIEIKDQGRVEYYEEVWYPILAKIDKYKPLKDKVEYNFFPGLHLDKCISNVYPYTYLIAKYSCFSKDPQNLDKAYLLLKEMEYQHLAKISSDPKIDGQLINHCLSIVTQQSYQLYN